MVTAADILTLYGIQQFQQEASFPPAISSPALQAGIRSALQVT